MKKEVFKNRADSISKIIIGHAQEHSLFEEEISEMIIEWFKDNVTEPPLDRLNDAIKND